MSADANAGAHAAPLADEEAERADLYALLARLFYAPPDGKLLALLAHAGGGSEGSVGAAWRELVAAAGRAQPEPLREEYETLFVGTGKAPVSLYSTGYTLRYASESPLAELRGTLAAIGIARRHEVHEPEDHIAALCDAMRFLIVEKRAPLAAQQQFFERWMAPVAEKLCDAIDVMPSTGFYRAVGRLAKEFFDIEHRAFEML